MLSFVDYRRFGKWEINGEWGKDRGPDPISNYEVLFIKYKKVLYKFLIKLGLSYIIFTFIFINEGLPLQYIEQLGRCSI